jgi:Tumour-associated protein
MQNFSVCLFLEYALSSHQLCGMLQALAGLVILTYVHFAFNRDPVNCLADISSTWVHNGILRVEVLTNSSQIQEYTLANSYNKELIMYGAEVEDEHAGVNATQSSNVTVDSKCVLVAECGMKVI